LDKFSSIEPESNKEESEKVETSSSKFESSEDDFFNGSYEEAGEISPLSERPEKLEYWMFKITPKGKEKISECYERGLGGTIAPDYSMGENVKEKALRAVAFSQLTGDWYHGDYSNKIFKQLEDEGLIVFVGRKPKKVVKESIEEIREACGSDHGSPIISNGTDARYFIDVLSAYENDDVDEETLDKAIEAARFIVRNEIHHPRWVRKAMRLLEAGEDKKVVLNKLLYALYNWTPACAYPFGEFETKIWTPVYSAVFSLFEEGNLELDEETAKEFGKENRPGELMESEPGGGHKDVEIKHFILDDEKTRYGLVRISFDWNDERMEKSYLLDEKSRNKLSSVIQSFVDMNAGDAEIVETNQYEVTLRYYTQHFLDRLLEYLKSNKMYVTLRHDAEFG